MSEDPPPPVPTPDQALKQLEWLQAIITRMANNSFLIKGWSTTVAAALLALSAKDSDRSFAFLAVYPAAVFWFLDANYLRLERIFRAKYEKLAKPMGLGLSAKPTPGTGFGHALFALATWPYYLMVGVVAAIIAWRG
jgi:hypothetical protein